MPSNDQQTSSSPSLGEDFRIQVSKFRDFVRHSDLFNLLQDISSSKLILDFRTRPEFEDSHLPCAQCLSVTSSSSTPSDLKEEVVEEGKKPPPKRLFLEDFFLQGEGEGGEEEVTKKDLFSKLTSVCPQFNHRGFVYKNVILYGGPEHLEPIKLLAVFLLKEKVYSVLPPLPFLFLLCFLLSFLLFLCSSCSLSTFFLYLTSRLLSSC
jgi:hypothetical protein